MSVSERTDPVTWDTTEEEYFHFLTLQFDIRAAKRILAARKRTKMETVTVADVKDLVGKPGKICFGGVSVQWGVVQATPEKFDLTRPLIVAQVTIKKKTHNIVIDGYHRIARATLEGVESLPCVVLTKAETEKVML